MRFGRKRAPRPDSLLRGRSTKRRRIVLKSSESKGCGFRTLLQEQDSLKVVAEIGGGDLERFCLRRIVKLNACLLETQDREPKELAHKLDVGAIRFRRADSRHTGRGF